MKYLLLLIFLIPFQISFGQYYSNTDKKVFNTSGNAIIRIQPNQVLLSLGVESRGKELLPTKNRNYKIIEQVISYCKNQGIPEKYIQTDYIRINPHYEYGKDVNIDYFSIVQSISIIIEDLENYDEILTELFNIGINRVNNIEFRTTKMEEIRYKVRKMAIEAAKEKAKFLTDQVGIKLGKIINIGENVSNPINSFVRSNYANITQNVIHRNNNNENGSLSIGMISIKATVSLTYLIKE